MKLESRRELAFASSKPGGLLGAFAALTCRQLAASLRRDSHRESAEECLRPGSDRVAMRFEDAQKIVYTLFRRAGLSLRRGGRFEDAERLSVQPEPEFNEENASCAYVDSKQAHGTVF